MEHAAEIVSVDYNFLNVMRAVYPERAGKITVIPNPVDASEFHPGIASPERLLTVLYPRRLDPVRVSKRSNLLLTRIPMCAFAWPSTTTFLKPTSISERLRERPFTGRVTMDRTPFASMPEVYRGPLRRGPSETIL